MSVAPLEMAIYSTFQSSKVWLFQLFMHQGVWSRLTPDKGMFLACPTDFEKEEHDLIPSKQYRAIALIDRDGCLIEEKEYLSDPEGVVLLPRAARALKLLEEQGIARIVTTNQSGVGRGYYTENDVQRVHERLGELLAAEGTRWDGIYFATADPSASQSTSPEQLHRRKPQPGMAEEAIADLGLQGLPVFAIGDKLADVEFGVNAGGEGILVRTGYGKDSEKNLRETPLAGASVANDLYDGVRIILNKLNLSAYADDATMARKLRTPGELREICAELKAQGKRPVFANGCFDLLHGGHISFLESSRAAGDCLILGVNSNASIHRLKGEGRPIFDEASRLQLLAALEAVDYLTVFYTDSADEVLEEIHPAAHAKGTDYRSDNVPELQTSRRLGIETVIAGNPKENSTRDIIEVVLERAKSGIV